MIITVTLNPALDYTVWTENFTLGVTNRASEASLRVGGKGINVSAVLSAFGVPTLALTFVAGEIGRVIEQKLSALDFPSKTIWTAGENRINVKIKSGVETELNGKGVEVTKEAYDALKSALNEAKRGDIVVLSGSVPSGLKKTVYADLMREFSLRGVRFVVDGTGEALKTALPLEPLLVKPNETELGELFGVQIENKTQAIEYAKKLCEVGAQNALVSLGADGAVFVSRNGECFVSNAPQGKVVDTVGAGDSVVAGFLYAFERGRDLNTAFLTGVASGSATAFSQGLATKEKTEELLGQLQNRTRGSL